MFCKLLFVRLEFTKYFSDYLFHFYYLLDYPELTSFIVITCRTVGCNYEGKKRRKQCEIDFVVNMGARRYYIQSALSVSDPDKMTTELRPLKNTKDFFKKIIISKSNAKPWIDEDGIVHIGLYDFLLNQNSLEL